MTCTGIPRTVRVVVLCNTFAKVFDKQNKRDNGLNRRVKIRNFLLEFSYTLRVSIYLEKYIIRRRDQLKHHATKCCSI